MRDPRRPHYGNDVVAVILGYLPILAVFVYKAFINPRPYWIHYYDPETIYFYSSLNILSGGIPLHNDHPGTPLQLLGALLLLFTGQDPLQFDAYRLLLYAVTLVLSIAATFLLIRALLAPVSMLWKIIVIWSLYLFPLTLEYLNVWAPEILYIPFGSLAIVLLWAALTRPESALASLLAGVAIGSCCALKFAFGTWAGALLVVLALDRATPDWRTKSLRVLLGGLGILLGFVLWTSIVIPRYPQMFGFVTRLITHQGPYGAGPAGIASFQEIVNNFKIILVTAKGWWLWLTVGLILALASLRSAWVSASDEWRPLQGLFLFAVIALTGSFLAPLVVEPGGYRYSMPASLAATLLFIIGAKNTAKYLIPQWVPVGVMSVAAVLLLKTLQVDINAHISRINSGISLRQQLDDIISQQELANPVVLYSFRVPQPSFGLLTGIPLLTKPDGVVRRIESRYPNEGYLDIFWSRIVLPSQAAHWDFLVVQRLNLPAFEEAYEATADENISIIGQVNDYFIVQRKSVSQQ